MNNAARSTQRSKASPGSKPAQDPSTQELVLEVRERSLATLAILDSACERLGRIPADNPEMLRALVFAARDEAKRAFAGAEGIMHQVLVGCLIGLALVGCGNIDGGQCNYDAERQGRMAAGNAASCQILLGQCPHRGGDKCHNQCADREAPNVAWPGGIGSSPGREGQGCDVTVGVREFDALSWDTVKQHPTLWEVKTADWSNAAVYNDFTKMCELSNEVNTFIDDCLQVLVCNKSIADLNLKLHYVLAVPDEGLYHAINDYFAVPANMNDIRSQRPGRRH